MRWWLKRCERTEDGDRRSGGGVTSLKADALAAMIAHAREAAPAECCGLLLGRDDAVLEVLGQEDAK